MGEKGDGEKRSQEKTNESPAWTWRRVRLWLLYWMKPAAPVVHQAPKDPREKSLKEKTPEELAAESEMFRKLRESMAPAAATARPFS